MYRNQHQQRNKVRSAAGPAPMRRPGAIAGYSASKPSVGIRQMEHPLCNMPENSRLFEYEKTVKNAFDEIVPVLKEVSSLQHETDFEFRAQQIAMNKLGFKLPKFILADAWIEQLDMRRLFAWSVFETYKKFCANFFTTDPLELRGEDEFQSFLQDCGFHMLDITPCADGRLAHVIRYVLRMPQRAVRRKSFAGAMFDIDDSIQKWVETEMLRYREGKPNPATEATRYLKMVAYHYSSIDPETQGCAAHDSDVTKASGSALMQLQSFKEAIENSFCCGASIDLLLIGIDTDTDSMRVHVPDNDGKIRLDRYVDTMDVYKVTQYGSPVEGREFIVNQICSNAPEVMEGMLTFIAQLIENNLSQIDYVRRYHGNSYPDAGHAERFIGAGIGFEEIQLRNLMYFSYLDTVEEAAQDLDVGIKIFKGLNVSRGLPVPVVIRFDYHANVPGARDRAIARCERVASAIKTRYSDIYAKGLLHIMQAIRDCQTDSFIEVLSCSVNVEQNAEVH